MSDAPPWMLLISADATFDEVWSKINRFVQDGSDYFRPDLRRTTDRMHLVTLDSAGWRRLEQFALDDEGAGRLLAYVEEVRRRFGGGTGFVILDCLSDFLPAGVDENSNAEMRAVMGRLSDIAQRTGVILVATHHWPKGAHPKGTSTGSEYSPLTAARGASAITTKARVVISLEQDGDDPSRRIQRVIGNELPHLEPQIWEVCDPKLGRRGIFYWRLLAAAELLANKTDSLERLHEFVERLQVGVHYRQAEGVRIMRGKEPGDSAYRDTPANRRALKELIREGVNEGYVEENAQRGRAWRFWKVATRKGEGDCDSSTTEPAREEGEEEGASPSRAGFPNSIAGNGSQPVARKN